MPRTRRLAREKDFGRAYKEGSRAKGHLLTVIVVENGLAHSRVGLSVGKKCWSSAVKRNRVRRVFREAFRLSQADLPRGYDLVLVASTPKLEASLAPTRSELVYLARKAERRFLERKDAAR